MPFKPKASKFFHYDFQIKGCRFHGSCGTADFEKAKSIEAEARFKAKNNTHKLGLFTLSEALGTYWRDISQHQPSARVTTVQSKNLLKGLGAKKRIDKLTNADIQHHVSRRRASVANATVNRELQLLGRAMRHMERVYSAKIPDLDIKGAYTKEPTERVRELSMDEQNALFEALRPDFHPFVKFALMTGARKTTIRELLWRDVVFDTRTVVFRLKGGYRMTFPINNEMAALLSSLLVSKSLEHARFVFTFVDQAKQQRRRFVPGGFHGPWLGAVRTAGIEDFRFHDLRHTFATRMLRQTGNLKLVSRLLGHKSIDATMKYAHVLQDDMRDALANFSALGSIQSREKSRSTTGKSY